MKTIDNLGVRAVQTPPVEPDVTLTLPADVARTLLRITSGVSGSPATSYRAHTDAIGRALRQVGVKDLRFGSRFNGGLDARDFGDAE